MPNNIILAHGLLTDGAAVTSSGAFSASFAATNVILKQPTQRLRMTGCVSEWVQIALASAAQPIDLVMVMGNLSPYAEIDILAAASTESLPGTPAWSASNLLDPAIPADHSLNPTLDLDFVSDSYIHGLAARTRVIRVYQLPAAQSFRAWRIIVRDPCNPAGFIEINRVILASQWQLSRNMGYGWEIGLIDDSTSERTIGGSTMTAHRGQVRRFNLAISPMAEAEMLGQGFALDELVGLKREVLLLADPAATEQFQRKSVYGKMAELAPVQNIAHGYWSKRYAIEELV